MTLRTLGTWVALAVGVLLALASAANAGLIDHWAFDETSGTNADDTGSGNHDGTISGATINQTGKLGQAYSFDGSNDTVTMTGYKGITGKASRTITLWVNTDGTGDGTPAYGRALIGWGDTSADGALYQLSLNKETGGGRTTNAPRISVSAGTRTGDTSAAGSTWKLVTVTLYNDGTPNANELNFYINGTLSGNSQTTAKAINTVSSNAVLIGSGVADPTGYGYFKGLMDDVAIWDEALTADLVKGLYDVGNSSALAYDAGKFNQLKTVFEAQTGSVTIGSLEWSYATGLGSTAGLSGSGTDFTLVLNATAGTGLTSVPEPATAALLLGGFGLTALFRRRRRSRA